MEQCVRFRLLYGGFLFTDRCLGCKFDFFFFHLYLLCSDCRCEHDGQGHGGPDSEERHRQRHGGVHLPGGELHRRLPPLGVAHRGGRCVGRDADSQTRGVVSSADVSLLVCLSFFPSWRLQSCRPRRCPPRPTWRSSSTAWASSSSSSSPPPPWSAGSAARRRRATSATSWPSRSWPRASR